MKVQVNIYGSPWATNSALEAQEFIRRALSNDIEIKRVFFFFDGVYQSLATQSPSSDEYDLLTEWRSLSEKGIELLVCIAAATNRGILNSEEAARYDKQVISLADSFELVGLGQWAMGFSDCDKIISFK